MTFYDESLLNEMISILLSLYPNFSFLNRLYPKTIKGKRALLRGLMNLVPAPFSHQRFFDLENILLESEKEGKEAVNSMLLPASAYDKITHFKGDICLLEVDAIVCSHSEEFLGCFVPDHFCLENNIHSAAGIELRNDCYFIKQSNKKHMVPGFVAISDGHHLRAKKVIHALLPKADKRPTNLDYHLLKVCYENILRCAYQEKIKTLAIPTLGTGSSGFPKKEAFSIAFDTVEDFLLEKKDAPIVIFVTYTSEDHNIVEESIGI